MIKIENVVLPSPAQWMAVIRGMRNPMNSWEKTDSYTTHIEDLETLETAEYEFFAGDSDLDLMKRLSKAGNDHGKYLRMINVSIDITAPLYWVAEHDTYKVGTVRNSCSFMHRGTAKPFEITDFSVYDNRVYEILSPIIKKHYDLKYPYETDEFRIYETESGRKYKVYRNGRIFRCAFELADSCGSGRTRTFEEKEVIPSENKNGYYEINIGGRAGERWLVHRLVAHVWIDNKNRLETVNHINGNKGDNSVENLEYMTRSDNIKAGYEDGLYDNIGSLHHRYRLWKNGSDGIPKDSWGNENYELFHLCLTWEKTIEMLNILRQEYIDTKDETVFQQIRQILPQGYNVRYTWMANYAVLRNIYHSRKDHRLPEWREFCAWIETLPYFKEICVEGDE